MDPMLPADHDTRMRTLLEWGKLVEDPESVNPFLLGEMVVTLIHEHIAQMLQLELLRGIDGDPRART